MTKRNVQLLYIHKRSKAWRNTGKAHQLSNSHADQQLEEIDKQVTFFRRGVTRLDGARGKKQI